MIIGGIRMYRDIFILIPSYNPTSKLLKVVRGLREKGFENIVVVDDGSEDKEMFKKIEVNEILSYEKNKGKGYALKTGFQYLNSKECLGVITIDDDLQHHPTDVLKVADMFLKTKEVVLGVRKFEKAPFIRKMANKLSAFIFNKKHHTNFVDIQTGLRSFPKEMLKDLSKIDGDGFEYELNVLKYLKNKPVHMVFIKTIYADEISHYKSFKDSKKILKAILKK